MRKRLFAIGAILFVAYGCTTTAPTAPEPEKLHGVASWYGQEFAGRTTANGEIFDPMLLTAAHRTLPFGTIVDVLNPKTKQSVRVRVNDRGPYVGDRLIDLSYAAARQIGLIEPGKGDVDISIVEIGKGLREAPAAFVVTVPDVAEKVGVMATDAPKVDFPLPSGEKVQPADEVSNVTVVEEHAGVETRRQVSADGKTVGTVPVRPASAVPAAPPAPRRVVVHPSGKFVVQVGAFAVEANAKSLQTRLTQLGQRSYVDRDSLYRVRIGPFITREEAIRARGSLEASGMSAIVVTE
jgi:peptidoglycan lytic transglycosylase